MKKLNLKIKDMPYAAEEALNRLRVNIKFCGKNTKKIVITSSVPNEGKSTDLGGILPRRMPFFC